MDIPLVSPRKLDQYVARYPGVWIVDVRSGEEYRRSHIRYAVNIPYEPGDDTTGIPCPFRGRRNYRI